MGLRKLSFKDVELNITDILLETFWPYQMLCIFSRSDLFMQNTTVHYYEEDAWFQSYWLK